MSNKQQQGEREAMKDHQIVRRYVCASSSGTAHEQQAALEALERMRASYLRLCRDYTVSTSGWGQVPGGSQLEGIDAQQRLLDALEIGASEEAREAVIR